MSRYFQLLSDLISAAASQPRLWLAVLAAALLLALASALVLRRQRHEQQVATTWSVQVSGLAPAARSFSLPPGTSAVPEDQGAVTDNVGADDAQTPPAASGSPAEPSSTQSLAWWDDSSGETWWDSENTQPATPAVPSVYAALAANDDDAATVQRAAPPERDEASTPGESKAADSPNRG